jgi:hypothetical protein
VSPRLPGPIHRTETIVIDRRFCGPADSGHGGYVSGLLAAHFEAPAQITLRAPPPLEKPLVITRVKDATVVLRDGDRLLAEATPGNVELEVPAPVSYDEALEASKSFIGLRDDYDYLTCFGCGRERVDSGGLGLSPGSTGRPGVLATPWIPDPSLADDNGLVRAEFLWSALDCPGGIAGMGGRSKPLLLGRFAVRIDEPVRVGEKCVLMGWALSREGRKHFVGSALFDESTRACGVGKATWIEPRPAR